MEGRGWLNIFQKFWGSFEDVFGIGLVVLDIKGAEGGRGVNTFQKFWGSLEVILRYLLGCFEVVFGGMLFLNLHTQNLPHRIPNQGGKGSRPLLENVQK